MKIRSLATLLLLLSPGLASAQANVTSLAKVSTAPDGSAPNASSGDLFSGAAAIDALGSKAAFMSAATNLVTAANTGVPQVFLNDLSGGGLQLLSTDGVSPGNAASGVAQPAQIASMAFSGDGGSLFFQSGATNFGGASNTALDIFRLNLSLPDTDPSRITLVSRTEGGAEPMLDSFDVSPSQDGSTAVFTSRAALVSADTNNTTDIYRVTGIGSSPVVSLVTRANGSSAAHNGSASQPVQSRDGRFVAFVSDGNDLMPSSSPDLSDNNIQEVFVLDLVGNRIDRLSKPSANETTFDSDTPAISADGSLVAFRSEVPNLVKGDTNSAGDVFIVDISGNALTPFRVSVNSNGVQANRDSGSGGISLSQDGRFVAFASIATNLTSDRTNGATQIFVHDRQFKATYLVSKNAAGEPANDDCGSPRLSADGTALLYTSAATNLGFTADPNAGVTDVFLARLQYPVPFVPSAPPAAPIVTVVGNQATFVLQPFQAPKARRSRAETEAAKKKPPAKTKKTTVTYQVTITNVGTNAVRRVNSKKNVVTIPNLAPGSYTATYRAQLVREKKVIKKTPQSPASSFTVS